MSIVNISLDKLFFETIKLFVIDILLMILFLDIYYFETIGLFILVIDISLFYLYLNQFFIYNTADFIKIVKKFILVFFK